MKRLLPTITLLLLTASVATAAPITEAALRTWAERSLVSCAGSRVELTKIDKQGPAHFAVWRVVQTSDEGRCDRQTLILASEKTGQVILGDMWVIQDGEPQKVLSEFGSKMFQTEVTASISPTPLTDGIREVKLTRNTPYGPLALTGWLDQSGRFFIVGQRGPIGGDIRQRMNATLSKSAPMRGNADAKVTVIELSDFQCPGCKVAHEKLEPLMKRNLDKIRYFRVDFPIFEQHDWALEAAMAARAIHHVAPQAYWAFVEYMFDRQVMTHRGNLETSVREFAENHQLEWEKIESFYRSESERKKLVDQVALLFDLGMFQTPTYLIDGQIVDSNDGGAFLTQRLREAVQ